MIKELVAGLILMGIIVGWTLPSLAGEMGESSYEYCCSPNHSYDNGVLSPLYEVSPKSIAVINCSKIVCQDYNSDNINSEDEFNRKRVGGSKT